MGANGPEPDMSRMLSGHPETVVMPAPPKLPEGGPWVWVGSGTNTAYAGPWGTTFAINLTSDKETGLGGWTEDIFVKAIKTGKHMGAGRPILPPMPAAAYAQYPEQDLKAIFSYLKTLKPVKNRVPDYVPQK